MKSTDFEFKYLTIKEKEQYRIELISNVSKKLKLSSKNDNVNFSFVWRNYFGSEMEHYKKPFEEKTLDIWFTNEGLERILFGLRYGRFPKKRK